MIISCPNCSTQFRLNADLLGDAGRTVKCAKCAHRWFAEPSALSEEPDAVPAAPAAAPAPPPPAPPPPAPPPPAPPPPEETEEEADAMAEDDEPAPPPSDEAADEEDESEASPPPIPTEEEIAQFQVRPEAHPSTLKWWILLLVVIVLVVGSLIALPRYIVAMYPPMNKLYVLIGMGGDVLGSGLEISDNKIETRLDGKDRVVTIKGEIKNTTGHVIDVPLLRGAIKDSSGKDLRVWSFRTKEPRVLAGEAISYETEIRNPPRGGVNVNIIFTDEAEMKAEKARAKESRTKK